ncbi:MAG TPA: F0F1 ATP synthase subunit gamma [Candidatus Absconditabacterales bacterium]|nr:F0F1 ATP synthase subunit gamma [Candidatus Absconditabacterales bacterium]HPK27747.1 F0F1 ATP synthase subunit gamma [Candidatus Absconditabacterales bacterium]
MTDAKKIKSVSNLGQITENLEQVSAFKLQKIRKQTENYKQFMKDFLEIFSSVGFDGEPVNDKGKDLVFVISSDNGFSGNSNQRLFKNIAEKYKNNKEALNIYCLGKKSLDYFLKEGFNVVGYTNLPEEFTEQDFIEIYNYVESSISDKIYSSIKVCFNYFKNTLIRTPVTFNLFPFNKRSLDAFIGNMNIDLNFFSLDSNNLMVGSNLQELKQEMNKQISGYIIYGAVLQNKIGELTLDMLLMKNIKNNANETVRGLVASFNKIRESLLTQEVSRIMTSKMFVES